MERKNVKEEEKLISLNHLSYSFADLEDEESQMKEVICCKISRVKLILTSILSLTLIPLLLMYWYDAIKYYLLFSDCLVQEATYLAIRNKDSTLELVKINKSVSNNSELNFGLVKYRYLPYEIIDHHLKPIKYDYQVSCNTLLHNFENRREKILTKSGKRKIRDRFGKCLINTPLKNVFFIVLDEVLNPFYLFQVFSTCLWYYEKYYYYASFIVIASIGSIIYETYELRANMVEMRKMAEIKTQVYIEKNYSDIVIRNKENENEVEKFKEYELLSSDNLRNINKNTIEEQKSYIKQSIQDEVPEQPFGLDKEGNKIDPVISKNSKEVKMNHFSSHDGLQYLKMKEEKIRNYIDKRFEQISSIDILPGDIIQIERGMKLPCDILLMEGMCVVDESMLNGESLPVPKSALINKSEVYSPDNDKKYTLYAGTNVKSIKELGKSKVLGLVIRTGFSTINGSLFRYMLYPRPTKFTFYIDAYKFIAAYFLLSIIGLIIQITMTSWAAKEIVIGFLDLITVIVPPALPSAMSVGITFSISRLKGQQITCIAPAKMNVAGTINIMCFDKTGTLTDTSLNLVKLVPSIKESHFGKSYDLSTKMINFDNVVSKDFDPSSSNFSLMKFYQCMGCCHTLIELQENNKKVLEGDPLEVEMQKYLGFIPTEYENVKAKFQDKEEFENYFYLDLGREPILITGIIKTFEFNAGLQRMSNIIFSTDQNSYELLSKGSPEKIKELCIPDTIPSNYEQVFNSFTKEGLRVIALAYRPLPISLDKIKNLERTEAESQLLFLGFLIFENLLKPSSMPSIDELHEANIETLMLTGDNVWTAANVAKKCHILDEKLPIYVGKINNQSSLDWVLINQETVKISNEVSKEQKSISNNLDIQNQDTDEFFNIKNKIPENPQFAISNEILVKIFEIDPDAKSEITKILLERTLVFARMSPDTKAKVVAYLQKANFNVGMCGDGANDCKALKQADIGVSLSVAEASIAAPFSSKLFDISSVLIVLKEGRAALTNSLECFKYMSLYSIIQFISIIILNAISSTLTDNQFLFEDLFLIVPLAITMSYCKASNKLSLIKAVESLISIPVLISVIGHALIIIASQLGIFFLTKKQDFYVEFEYDDEIEPDDMANKVCHLNTVVFLISIFQLVAMSAALSFGTFFREPIYKNIAFIINLFICFVIIYIALMITPYDWIVTIFNFYANPPITKEYQWALFGWVTINSIIIIVFEQLAVEKVIECLNKSKPIKSNFK